MSHKKTLIIILGPTASGKTGVAVELAKYLNTEIISCDSRQFYKEMQIGTARATEKEMQGVPHHFVGNLSVMDYYNVSMFEKEALSTIENIHKNSDFAIMAGGTGLYINGICNGIDDLPDPTPETKEYLTTLYRENGISALQDKLLEMDSAYYKKVDLNNHKRLLRALEVCMSSDKTYTELKTSPKKERPFNIIKIGLNMERSEIIERIHHRTDLMIKKGLVEEVKNLEKHRDLNALNTVGYKEIFEFLDGITTLERAIENIKTNTRRYAKRQITWFKRDESIHWFHPNDIQKIKDFLS
ncbi:MAG: tRNA (adenosine(37)-N6)-dimethylallyltransferase MiaA [Bacteroidota bacterium]|nr:tRNA (adenosine(37)-N6)-dimethylallyltransferase MiaA [Bacteroidota bacterium]